MEEVEPCGGVLVEDVHVPAVRSHRLSLDS